MKPIEFQLRGDYVELCDLLKLVGLVQSAGEGKHRVADGEVSVDGKAELRKTAKIRADQRVQFGPNVIVILGNAHSSEG